MDFQPIIDFIRKLYPDRDIIHLHEPYFGGNEKKYLMDCIDSTYVSSVGTYVGHFEEMVRDFIGACHAVATVNGTSALHVALTLAGVQRGDLVLTQPLTFVATCNAITFCGAEPVFIDIDRQTLGLSANALEAWLSTNAIVEDGQCYYSGVHELHESTRMKDKMQKYTATSCDDENLGWGVTDKLNSKDPQLVQIREISGRQRISACVPMHTFGHPCQIDSIVDICNRFHIPVVEDAAESIGSYNKGRHTGTFGKLGILSFNGNKTITTGGGGMIITDDEKLGRMAKHITTTAKLSHPWNFVHDMVGYNYRLPNINAALGCAQMELLPAILENKRETAQKYEDFFSEDTCPLFVRQPDDSRSNYWLNAILLKDEEERDAFLAAANEAKIMVRPAWKLMHSLPMYERCLHSGLDNSADIASRLVNLPSSYRRT